MSKKQDKDIYCVSLLTHDNGHVINFKKYKYRLGNSIENWITKSLQQFYKLERFEYSLIKLEDTDTLISYDLFVDTTDIPQNSVYKFKVQVKKEGTFVEELVTNAVI